MRSCFRVVAILASLWIGASTSTPRTILIAKAQNERELNVYGTALVGAVRKIHRALQAPIPFHQDRSTRALPAKR